MELITAIALLCQIHPTSTGKFVSIDSHQLDCQKYYAKCLLESKEKRILKGLQTQILECILKREIS